MPLLIAVAALVLVSCDEAETEVRPAGRQSDSEPYRIAATIGMVADIVRNVAGDEAVVETIIGEGVDPHVYTPTRADVVTLSEADVIFYNGLLLEGRMADTLVRIARAGKPVHAVTELIDEAYIRMDESEHYDPHVWMDVRGWSLAVRAVAEALGEYDPAHAETYHADAAAYMAKLEELDAYAKQAIGSIPERQRVLITAHDAFGYFGRAYDIEVRGIQGLSTESEAGVKDINDLIDYIVESEIPAVFVETSVADKNVRALVEGAKAHGHDVVIGGSLYSDAMGQPGTYEGTYIGMIDHNVTTIARALGGEAPAGGMQGRLRHEPD